MSMWSSLLAAVTLLSACTINLAKSGDDGQGNQVLNDSIDWPANAYALMDPQTDDSVAIEAAPAGSTTAAVMAGDALGVSVPFSSPNANVVGVGIRFGTSGPIMTIPTSTMGQKSGTLSASVPIPPAVCGMLSSICHNIKCYEYAVTSVGKISRANIMSLALMCGNCSEPSCRDLLPAMCPSTPGGTTCTDAGPCQREGSSAHIQACVVVSGSCPSVYYVTSGGRRFDCSTSCQVECLPAAQAAVTYCNP